MDTIDRAQEAQDLYINDAVEAARKMKQGPQRKTGETVICLDCGDPLPPARIAAVPCASRCVHCQSIFEACC